MIQINIIYQNPFLKKASSDKISETGAIVSAACLAHDMGNPPFGHSGEKAIGEFFISGNGAEYQPFLSAKQWQDLIEFEGNANGFRILTDNSSGAGSGLRLSYATLGAFIKYPKESLPKKSINFKKNEPEEEKKSLQSYIIAILVDRFQKLSSEQPKDEELKIEVV